MKPVMRASRLLSMVMALQVRKRATAEALADELGVSVRTVYRDFEALSAAGIPIVGERGPGGGFALLEGYRSNLTALSSDEAEAVLMMGLPEQAKALGMGPAAARAKEKLLTSLARNGSGEATHFAGRFHFDSTEWYRRARPVPHLALIARAVLDQRRLEMTYQSWTSSRSWTVEPLGVVLKAGSWYLVATGHGKVRTFNVADVQRVALLPTSFTRPPGFDLPTYWRESLERFEERLRPHRAELVASPLGLRRLQALGTFAAQAVEKAGTTDERGWRRVRLPFESVESATLMLAGIGPELEVLAPVELRRSLGELGRAIAKRMRSRKRPRARRRTH